jgi:protection-of-telomeres protein 1
LFYDISFLLLTTIIVKVQNIAIPYRYVSDILHNESHNNTTPDGVEYRLPFQNVRYRSRLRVVDFFPHSLEDFAVRYKTDYDYLSDVETDDEEAELENEPPGSVKWEWRFCLLVEDGVSTKQNAKDQPKERMELLVARADAEFLLNMAAVE